MEVILLERVEKLGQMGDVVSVKPGFARNYLLPQKKALRSSKANLALFESQRAQLEADNLKRRDEAQAVADKIADFKVVMIRQAGESGQLYGSVTSRDVAAAVTEEGATVARSQVVLDRPIKVLGLHDVRLRLHPEVSVVITINIARSEAEAEMQEEAGRFVSVEEQQAAAEAAEAKAIAAAEAAEAEESATETAAEGTEAAEAEIEGEEEA